MHASRPCSEYQRHDERIAQVGNPVDLGSGTASACWGIISPMPQLSPVHWGQAASTHGEENLNACSGRPRALTCVTNSASTLVGGWRYASLPLEVITPSSSAPSSHGALGHAFLASRPFPARAGWQ